VTPRPRRWFSASWQLALTPGDWKDDLRVVYRRARQVDDLTG
jgi:hypothetical protein